MKIILTIVFLILAGAAQAEVVGIATPAAPDYEVQYWQEHMNSIILQYRAQGCEDLMKEFQRSDAALKAVTKAREDVKLATKPTSTAKEKK